MMRKLIVLGIVAVMVMAVAGGASAANWIWFLHAENAAHQAQLVDATFGQMTAGTGRTNNNYPPAANVLVALEYTPNATGSYLNKDYRASITDAVLSYDVFVIAGSSYSDSKMYLKGWAPSATFQEKSPKWYLTSEDGKITYWEGAVPVASNAANAPVLYAFDTSTTGVKLKLTNTAIPEPGSMVALFSGFVGLVGYGIRRRK